MHLKPIMKAVLDLFVFVPTVCRPQVAPRPPTPPRPAGWTSLWQINHTAEPSSLAALGEGARAAE